MAAIAAKPHEAFLSLVILKKLNVPRLHGMERRNAAQVLMKVGLRLFSAGRVLFRASYSFLLQQRKALFLRLSTQGTLSSGKGPFDAASWAKELRRDSPSPDSE